MADKADHPIDVEALRQNPETFLVALMEAIENIANEKDAPEFAEKNRQLKEVDRLIKKFENSRTPVPEELRSLKTRLMAQLGAQEEVEQKLTALEEGLSEVVGTLRRSLGKRTGGKRQQRKRKYRTPRTDKKTLRVFLIEALQACGGSATRSEVLAWIEDKHGDEFLPGDYERHSGGAIVWRNTVSWTRARLVKEGVLKSDSPKGIWELSDGYR